VQISCAHFNQSRKIDVEIADMNLFALLSTRKIQYSFVVICCIELRKYDSPLRGGGNFISKVKLLMFVGPCIIVITEE